MSDAPTPHPYLMGHGDEEFLRLERQGQYLRELTRNVLLRAGVRPGMRVLDFGAGSGEVSRIAAELVGPTGQVVALDRSDEACARIRAYLDARGLHNVTVASGDESAVASLAGESGFDAIVGRLVLIHQPDPAATVARLATHLRPGGVLAFHEAEMDVPCWSNVPLPLMTWTWSRIEEAFRLGHLALDIGARIADGFARARLADATVIHEGRAESGPDSEAYGYLTITLRAAAAILARFGGSAVEVELDTLEARLREEAVAANAVFIPVYFVAVWGRRVG